MIDHHSQIIKARENDKRRLNPNKQEVPTQGDRYLALAKAYNIVNKKDFGSSQSASEDNMAARRFYGQQRARIIAGQRTRQAVEGLQEGGVFSPTPYTFNEQNTGNTAARTGFLRDDPDRGMSGNPNVRMDERQSFGYGMMPGNPPAKIPNSRGASGSSGVYRTSIGRLPNPIIDEGKFLSDRKLLKQKKLEMST